MGRHRRDDEPGRLHFRIRVAGRLGDGFAEGIDDGIEQHTVGDGTLLTGELVDQSHFYGILNHLQQLGVEVLRFETYRTGKQGNGNDDQAPTIS